MANENLAIIPYDFSDYKGNITYNGGKQITFLDHNVVRTIGKPSIRIEPHTSADLNIAREVDGKWYPAKPGDRILAKCWMKTDKSTPEENADIWHGARIGIDCYAHTNLGYGIIGYDVGDHIEGAGHPHWGDEHRKGMVMWNTPDWTQKILDFYIENKYYDRVVVTSEGLTQWQICEPIKVDSIVLWLQAMQVNDGTTKGNAWFADTELYINPVDVPPIPLWKLATAWVTGLGLATAVTSRIKH